jgi:hypothetical protein
MRKIFRMASIACALVTAVGGASLWTAGSASASAMECSQFGPVITVHGIGVHRGTECGNVSGSGDYVESVSSSFSSYTPVCNWNITAEFFRDLPNGDGNAWTYTINGAVHHSCNFIGSEGIGVDANEKTGFVCSTLKENGTRLTSWCAAIHP